VDAAQQYRMRAESLLDLAADLDDGHPIPATPAWNLRELIAHLVGVAVDVSGGQVEDYAPPHWTARQVVSRATSSRRALVEEWKASWPELCSILDDPVSHGLDSSFSVLPLVDVIAHEHDLRESVGMFDFSDPAVSSLVEQRRLQVLTVQGDASTQDLEVRTPEGDHWVIGGAEDRLTVTAERYELWRSLEGRRRRDAVRQFDWIVGPGPFLDHWVGSVFQWPEDEDTRANEEGLASPRWATRHLPHARLRQFANEHSSVRADQLNGLGYCEVKVQIYLAVR
jgi:hypothetical protein